MYDLVNGNVDLVDAVEEDPMLLPDVSKLNNGIQLLAELREKKNNKQRPAPKFYILTGPAGLGKTTLVKMLAEKHDYEINSSWSTDGHSIRTSGKPSAQIILFDNVGPTWAPPYDWLCRLTDAGAGRGRVTADIKYGLEVELRPEIVVVTSTTFPSSWWTGTQIYDRQLERRIAKWLDWDGTKWVDVTAARVGSTTFDFVEEQKAALDLLN